MGEKGIESPPTGTGAGAFPGLTVSGRPATAGLAAAAGLVGGAATGATTAATSAGPGISTAPTDATMAPDPTSPTAAFEPPKG